MVATPARYRRTCHPGAGSRLKQIFRTGRGERKASGTQPGEVVRQFIATIQEIGLTDPTPTPVRGQTLSIPIPREPHIEGELLSVVSMEFAIRLESLTMSSPGDWDVAQRSADLC